MSARRSSFWKSSRGAAIALPLALAVSFAIGGVIVEAVGPRWAYAFAGLSTTLALAIIARQHREDAELQHGTRV